jgi:hypothetical protein
MHIHRRPLALLYGLPRNLADWLRRVRALQPRIGGNKLCGALRTRAPPRPKIGRRNSDQHERRIPARPPKRLLFGFEKAIHHQRVAFERGAPGAPRCFTAAHRGAGVDRQQGGIGQSNFAAVRNAARIDGAMACPQACARRADVAPRPVIGPATPARPVDSDSREHGLLPRIRDWRYEHGQAQDYKESFHKSALVNPEVLVAVTSPVPANALPECVFLNSKLPLLLAPKRLIHLVLIAFALEC